MDSENSQSGSGAAQAATQPAPRGASEFLRESLAELKKVHTPTRAETIQATLVTLFIMVFVAVVLFVLDVLFKGLMHALVS